MDEPPLDTGSGWLIPLLCLLFGALLAALGETLSATGEVRLRAVRESNRPESSFARWLIAERDRMAATLLFGRVICVAIGAFSLAHWVGQHASFLYAFLSVAGFSLLFTWLAEIGITLAHLRLPKTTLLLFRIVVRPVYWLLSPLVVLLTMTSRAIKKMAHKMNDEDPAKLTQLEVEHLIEQSEEQGVFSEDQAELLLSVLEFKDTLTREVMVPRTRMIAIDIQTPLRDVLLLIEEKGHSRYPVYRERVDQVEGILYAKDLFKVVRQEHLDDINLQSLIRQNPLFVAESQKISFLLREMQARSVHLAVVVDSYGGTSGIVTLEDIVEEIVGEIRDEHDADEPMVQKTADNRFLVNASISLSDLQEALGEELPSLSGSVESLGGLLIEKFGKVPAVGETLTTDHLSFKVTEADARHITRVELQKIDNPASDHAAE